MSRRPTRIDPKRYLEPFDVQWPSSMPEFSSVPDTDIAMNIMAQVALTFDEHPYSSEFYDSLEFSTLEAAFDVKVVKTPTHLHVEGLEAAKIEAAVKSIQSAVKAVTHAERAYGASPRDMRDILNAAGIGMRDLGESFKQLAHATKNWHSQVKAATIPASGAGGVNPGGGGGSSMSVNLSNAGPGGGASFNFQGLGIDYKALIASYAPNTSPDFRTPSGSLKPVVFVGLNVGDLRDIHSAFTEIAWEHPSHVQVLFNDPESWVDPSEFAYIISPAMTIVPPDLSTLEILFEKVEEQERKTRGIGSGYAELSYIVKNSTSDPATFNTHQAYGLRALGNLRSLVLKELLSLTGLPRTTLVWESKDFVFTETARLVAVMRDHALYTTLKTKVDPKPGYDTDELDLSAELEG